MALDPSSPKSNWNYPTAVRFGAGRIAELPEACKALGMTRPLIVTDPGLARLPMIAEAVAVNVKAGLPTEVFSDVQGNPVGKNVEDGLKAYRAGKHDGVVAFGGGSALDAGKAIALMTGQKRSIFDFEDRDDWWTRVDPAGIAPIVGVPTTSGTGSEVGRSSVITDESVHLKKVIFHPKMQPAIVIADPALTLGLPANITAWTGMDALSHSLEAYCTTGYHPMAQGIAIEGMRLVKDWLPKAVKTGSDITARAHMMTASAMGATAFQKGLGAMHALSHPCSAMLNTHHGLTNAVVMPYVLVFNQKAIEEKMVALARYLDLPKPSTRAVIDWVLELRRTVGIPHTLAEIGVREEHVEQFAPMAANDVCASGNPVQVGAVEMAMLYRNAVRGILPN